MPNTTQIALFAAFSAFSCTTAPQSSEVPTTADDQAFVELMEAHDAAWNAHDVDALTAMFAVDGTLVTPTGTRLEGHDALRSSFAQPGPTKQTNSSTRLDRVQWIGEGVVVIDATQTLSGPGVEMLGSDTAHLVGVAKLVDGQWRLAAARPYVRMR